HCYRGIWLDWMAQGTRVTGNLFHDNGSDIFFEVDHGPFLADNNIFLSRNAVSLNSQGGAFVHNLFAGSLKLYQFDARQTPFLKAHSTALAGFHNNPSGDVRFYNNLFVRGADMSQLDKATLPVMMNGNVYLNGAKPARFENNPLVKNNWLVKMHLISAFKLSQRHGNYYLRMEFDKAWMTERTCEPVTSELLGKAVIPDLAFEQPDGEGISISTDYFGNRRNDSNPTAGPFERQPYAKRKLEVW
ncbi:MAG TPA: hypothetical protein VGJ73_11670, partial [Verrucomicrobiae bacterium]